MDSAILVGVDPAALSADERIDRLVVLEQLRCWVDAEQSRLLAAMAPPGERDDKEWVREEIACALRIAPVTVNARLHHARELVHRLPAALELLSGGAISPRHAGILVEATARLDDTIAAAVETRVLARAAIQTPTSFARSVRRAVLALDPADAQHRHTDALTDRRVCLRPAQDGMAELWALLPADGALRLLHHIDASAALTSPADERTADQRRADALIALADGAGNVGAGSAAGPAIQVTVAMSTLLGADEQPAELDGYGPVTAHVARRLAVDPTGTWRRLLTDPAGRLVDYGRTVYRPPAALDDHIRARDRRCRFPGCNRKARRTDIDHQTPWEHGGHTNADNLQCLCARHHHLKHEAGWHVTGNPAATLTWTTPTGHQYRDPPDPLPGSENSDQPRQSDGLRDSGDIRDSPDQAA